MEQGNAPKNVLKRSQDMDSEGQRCNIYFDRHKCNKLFLYIFLTLIFYYTLRYSTLLSQLF